MDRSIVAIRNTYTCVENYLDAIVLEYKTVYNIMLQ